MHFFLAGRLGSSTTRRLTSQLITTWDYFYNTGGWDDYPPQQYVHSKKLTRSVAPVANTAHAIRTAKILRMAALALGHRDDVLAYESDIAIWMDALQNYAWDQESGYFGYVMHDAEGRPTSILRDRGGVNFNMGIDGITPLLAGVCTASQVDTICRNLMSDTHLWTPIGVTTVDQSAPYYRNDGYWNGAVWMPHQWFIGKPYGTSAASGKPTGSRAQRSISGKRKSRHPTTASSISWCSRAAAPAGTSSAGCLAR